MFTSILKSFVRELRDDWKTESGRKSFRGQNSLADRFLMVSGLPRTVLLKQEVRCLLLDRKKEICNGEIDIG